MGESNLMMSEVMRNETTKVLSGIGTQKRESNVYNITASFSSKTATFSKETSKPLTYSQEIMEVRIIQDYVKNFTDKIFIRMEVLLQDALAFYNLRRDLHCRLEFYKLDPQQHVNYMESKPEIQNDYRVILLDNADIFKNISGARLNGPNNQEDQRNQITIRLNLELISEDVYVSRKKRINAVVRNTTMKAMLINVVNHFGFKYARIYEPDNTTNYVNFVIPPDRGVADIMTFMQNAPGMGVYKNGFCSYITEGCWYVFPRYGGYFSKRVVQIYSAGSTNFEGLNRYDWVQSLSDDDIMTHIIINGNVQETNWSALGTENRPNAANIMIDSLNVDQARVLKEDGKLYMEPVVRNIASLPTEPMDEDEPINLQFRHDHGNLYTIMSELGAFQQTTIGFTWKGCTPYTFHPGTVVKYNYDHQDNYRTITGRCEYVEYVFTKQKAPLYPMFFGIANVRISCDNVQALTDGCV